MLISSVLKSKLDVGLRGLRSIFSATGENLDISLETQSGLDFGLVVESSPIVSKSLEFVLEILVSSDVTLDRLKLVRFLSLGTFSLPA